MSKFEFKVPQTSFVIKSDSIYQIQPKTDASAPDGFKDFGTTKLIHPNIGNTVHAPYNETMKVWDTGFYKSSPIYRGLSEAEREQMIKVLKEHIVKPVEELKGEGVLHHQNNEFYDDFGIDLRAYRVFNTNDVLQRLALYFAVLGKEVAPKDQESNPLFKSAQYVVVNKEEAVNVRQEREMEKNDAIGIFYTLQNTDKEKLFDLLDYLNIASSRTTDKATLNSVFNRWLNDKTSGYQHSKIFLETYEKFEGEEGTEELYTYKTLKELEQKGYIKTKRGEVFLDGNPIGANHKLAAAHLMRNSDLKRKFAELAQNLEE
jgi:hypothetical protein